MARGDVVIANSHYTSDLIRSLYPGAAERIRIIHRGTELSIFSPAGWEGRPGIVRMSPASG